MDIPFMVPNFIFEGTSLLGREHVAEYLAATQSVLEELGDAIRKDDIAQRLSTPVKHSGFARLN